MKTKNVFPKEFSLFDFHSNAFFINLHSFIIYNSKPRLPIYFQITQILNLQPTLQFPHS